MHDLAEYETSSHHRLRDQTATRNRNKTKTEPPNVQLPANKAKQVRPTRIEVTTATGDWTCELGPLRPRLVSVWWLSECWDFPGLKRAAIQKGRNRAAKPIGIRSRRHAGCDSNVEPAKMATVKNEKHKMTANGTRTYCQLKGLSSRCIQTQLTFRPEAESQSESTNASWVAGHSKTHRLWRAMPTCTWTRTL